MTPAFALDEYLARIGSREQPCPDLVTVTAWHRAHVDAIPFENLGIQMGERVELEPEALQAAMVRRRRGGYCFQQNRLFALALEAIGLAPEMREARVRQNAAGTVRPRTHMVLTVACEGQQWLVDVGFGGDGLVEPVPLDGARAEQDGIAYRVHAEGTLRVLQRRAENQWEDLYAVLPDPVYPIDFEVANWFTSTHPRSPFVANVTAQRVTGGVRHILRNLTWSRARGTEVQTREISRSELVPLLRDTFGLDVPDDARFRALD